MNLMAKKQVKTSAVLSEKSDSQGEFMAALFNNLKFSNVYQQKQ
jgi:hypothetical protein